MIEADADIRRTSTSRLRVELRRCFSYNATSIDGSLLRTPVVVVLPEDFLVRAEVDCARGGGADLGIDQEDIGLEIPRLICRNRERFGQEQYRLTQAQGQRDAN